MALTVWNDKTVTGQYAGLVAASWKGKTYIRSAPSSVNNNSPAQQAHKQLYKFAYYHISPFYNLFLKNIYQVQKMTPANYIIKNLPPIYWTSTIPSQASQRFIYPYMNLNCTTTWNIRRNNPNYKIIGDRLSLSGQDIERATKIVFLIVPYTNEDFNTGHEETQILELPLTETHFEISFNANTMLNPKAFFYCVANNTECSFWKRW